MKKIVKKSKFKTLNKVATINVDSSVYTIEKKPISKEYSIFSSLNFLNRNTDYFVSTKNTISTVLTTIYTNEEIDTLIEQTNSTSFEDLVKKVKKAIKGKADSITLSHVSEKVETFLKDVKENNVTEDEAKNHEEKDTNSPITTEFTNNSEGLIANVVSVYGDNRYYARKVNYKIGKMLPLFVKFKDEKEANRIMNAIEGHINSVYGYKLKVGKKIPLKDAITRTISLDGYKSEMDQSVNMLYSVAKKMVGTKRVKLSQAKKILNKDEKNSFLNSSSIKRKEKRAIFKLYKDEIKDIVGTLTTIFMARFVYDSKYFGKIEKDLSEQVCYKMQNLKLSNNGLDDYWINELIQERLKVNCAQVLAANNITSADQLLEVYNKNGTKIVHPEKVTCLDDLIFAIQYNTHERVANKPLINLRQEKVKFTKKKGVLKNKQQKVKPPKPAKYLNEIRKSEAYKKYYEEYKAKFANLTLIKESDAEQLTEIIENSNDNLDKLEKLAGRNDLSEESTQKLPEEIAKNDAVIEVANELLSNENVETEEEPKVEEKTSIEESVKEESKEADKTKVEGNQPNLLDLIAKKEKELKLASYEASEDQPNLLDLIDQKEKELQEKALKDAEKEVEEVIDEDEVNPIFLDDEIDPELEEIDREDSNLLEKKIQYKGEKRLSELSEEEIEKKVHKFFSVIVNGKPNEQGVLDAMLNYRVVHVGDEEYAKKGNDSERLSDSKLKKVNEKRDFIADEFVDLSTSYVIGYYNEHKEEFADCRVKDLCLTYYKTAAKIESKTFTRKNLKQFAAVYIAKQTNKIIEKLGIEIYTGTNTYKKYNEAVDFATK